MAAVIVVRESRVARSPRRLTSEWALALIVVAGLLFTPIAATGAQATLGEMRRQATRAELQAAVTAAETALNSAPDKKTRDRYLETITAYKQRLQNGDFLPGDRILLQFTSDSVLSDTFTVRADRKLQLPNLPDISLHGVLDSELEPFLTNELRKYYRQVDLAATVLLRISVLGAVGRQDFITVPVDQAITDVISGVGGFAGPPDLGKAVVRREGKTFIDSRGLQEAFAKGKTVGDLSMRDGDVVYIPPAPAAGTSRWQGIVGVLSVVSGLAFALRWALNRP